MLDNVVLGYYLSTDAHRVLLPRAQDKARAADVAMATLELFRADLIHAGNAIDALRASLEGEGFTLSPVRILELMVWTEVEPAGYYR